MTAEPEVTTRRLQEGDEFLLLGCDGLWDVFPSQRAVEFARARSVLQLGTARTWGSWAQDRRWLIQSGVSSVG